MTVRKPWDEFEAGLGGLRTYDVDPERAERVRACCLAALKARQQKLMTLRRRFIASRAWLEPLVALSLSALYLAAAFSSSLALLQK